MIEDLRAGESPASVDADVCIAGAGPAGITLARELARNGISVCLLESGADEQEPDTQALSQGELTGHNVWLEEGRPRVFGGASSIWGGRLAKLDREDLLPRPWANSPGWPISREVLDAYYPAAAVVCGAEEIWEGDQSLLPKILPKREWTWDGKVKPHVWHYGSNGFRCYTHWAYVYGDELRQSPKVRLVLHANLVAFEAGKDRRVTAVIAKSLNGKSLRVTAKAFVLACGGIENARLLLASAESLPGGVQAGNDNVGRYFMQHPRGVAARIAGDQALGLALQDTFNVLTRRKPPQYEVGFALEQAVQAREGLLNCSGILEYEADPQSGWELMKDRGRRLLGRNMGPKTAGRLPNAFDLWLVGANLWRRGVRGGHALQGLKEIRVVVDVEQAPDPDSRITLSDQRDALGMRRVKVDWRLGDAERRTIRRFIELLGQQFQRLGAGTVVPEPWLDGVGPIPESALGDNIHHTGATRMSRTAADGVVDADLKVYGSPNVYVTGSSVFPTGGHANPTLTLIALTLRLADHLKAELARAPAAAREPRSEPA